MKNTPILRIKTDKQFWHRYTGFYDNLLKKIDKEEHFDLLEIGVFNSQSIKYWRSLYPNSRITGVDIKYEPTWFVDERIKYVKLDQSNVQGLQNLFYGLENPKIIIDDGSHIPFHQLIFLHTALKGLAKKQIGENNFLIIEDIQTSLKHSLLSRKLSLRKKFKLNIQKYLIKENQPSDPYLNICNHVNCLGLLLTVKKAKELNLPKIKIFETIPKINDIGKLEYKILDEILNLLINTKNISIFKRTALPDYCFQCGSQNFNSLTLECMVCKSDAYKLDDSMTVAIEI